jgi:hypothetical protein
MIRHPTPIPQPHFQLPFRQHYSCIAFALHYGSLRLVPRILLAFWDPSFVFATGWDDLRFVQWAKMLKGVKMHGYVY